MLLQVISSFKNIAGILFIEFQDVWFASVGEVFPVDVSPVIPLQVSIISSSQNITPKIPTKFVESENYILDTISFSLSRSLLSNITKLTLEGRTDVSGTMFLPMF